MNRLEEELKKALERVEPPAGFRERVLARAATEKSQKRARARFWFKWLGASGLRWATACALCVVLATSGILYHREQQRKGQEAKEQLMMALRITSSKLQIATESVRDIDSTEQPGR
jgi:hypothetical protein